MGLEGFDLLRERRDLGRRCELAQTLAKAAHVIRDPDRLAVVVGGHLLLLPPTVLVHAQHLVVERAEHVCQAVVVERRRRTAARELAHHLPGDRRRTPRRYVSLEVRQVPVDALQRLCSVVRGCIARNRSGRPWRSRLWLGRSA